MINIRIGRFPTRFNSNPGFSRNKIGLPFKIPTVLKIMLFYRKPKILFDLGITLIRIIIA